MPTVNIRMYEGRPQETKDQMAEKVKEVVAQFTGNRLDAVKVIYEEIARPTPSADKA